MNPGPDLRERALRQKSLGRGSNRDYTSVSGKTATESVNVVDSSKDTRIRPDHECLTTVRTSQQPGPSDRDRATNQLSLNNWLTRESQQTNEGDDDGCSVFSNQSDTEVDTSNVNVAAILLEIRSDVKTMNKEFDSLEHSVNSLKEENKEIRKENVELKSSVKKLSEQMKLYEEKLSETELKQEKQDMALRKNNLKIYGIAFSENETASQTEQKLRNYFSTELALNPDEPLLD
jgi:chromosome segregation ATPase